MVQLLGVDGCRTGWLGLSLDSGNGRLDVELAERWNDLPWRQAEMVAVDMPVGLAERGPRACDLAARRLLPPGRKSSVFAPPRRYMLACPDWTAAQAQGRTREGYGLSKQAWNITGKIRELDETIRPSDQVRVREVHPELVFHRLNGWHPLPSKRTAEGRRLRLALLSAAGVTNVVPLLDRFPRGAATPDDILDAAACVLAAQQMLMSGGTRLPTGTAPRDARGLRMEIWY